MKINLLSIICIILVYNFFTIGCRVEEPSLKNAADNKLLETTQKLQQYWYFRNGVSYVFIGSTTVIDRIDTLYFGKQSDYYIFHKNNKLYRSIDNLLDTLDYKITNENTVVIGNDIYTIDEITSTSLKLNFKLRTNLPYGDYVKSFYR